TACRSLATRASSACCGNSLFSSTSAACGAIRSVARSRTDWRSSSCSSDGAYPGRSAVMVPLVAGRSSADLLGRQTTFRRSGRSTRAAGGRAGVSAGRRPGAGRSERDRCCLHPSRRNLRAKQMNITMEARVTVPAVTRATGSSLQRLAEQGWERTGARAGMYFEGARGAGLQMGERGGGVSGGLRGAGLAAGERVVVCMANCPEVGIIYQAVWRAGAVATPVLFLLSETELRHVLTDSGAAFVVTTPEFLVKVQAAAAGTEVRAIIVCGALANGSGGGGLPLLDFAVLETAPEGALADADPDG